MAAQPQWGNDWQVGAIYIAGFNNIPWSQPGGPLTPVLPQQITGNSDLFTTLPYNELTGTYIGNCGHSFDQTMIFRDFDFFSDEEDKSVALICCPLCSTVQRVLAPYSAVLNPLQNAILFP